MSVSPAPRGRRAARPSGDDRELAILTTAERLLAERPLATISVDDLARGAGISRPTFYFYFASKDAVLLTLLDRVVAEADTASLAAFDTAPADHRGARAAPPRLARRVRPRARRPPGGMAAGDHRLLRHVPPAPRPHPGLGRGPVVEHRGARVVGAGVPGLGRPVGRGDRGRAGP